MDSTIAGSVNTPIGLCFLKLRPLYMIYDPCSPTFEMGFKREKIKTSAENWISHDTALCYDICTNK